MEELELVFEVFEGGADGVEAPALGDGGVDVGGAEFLGEDEAGGGGGGRMGIGFGDQGFDGGEEMGSGDGEDGVAELVVEVPDLLQQRFDLIHLHLPHRIIKQQ